MGADELHAVEVVFLQDVLPTFLAGVFVACLAALVVYRAAALMLRMLGEMSLWLLRQTGLEARLVRWQRLIELRELLVERRVREARHAH